jgi:beta-lactamase class A
MVAATAARPALSAPSLAPPHTMPATSRLSPSPPRRARAAAWVRAIAVLIVALAAPVAADPPGGEAPDESELRALVARAQREVPMLVGRDLWDEWGLQVVLAVSDPGGPLVFSRAPAASPAPYFYPASAIKPFVAVAALHAAAEQGVGLDTPLRIDALAVEHEGREVPVSEGARSTTLRSLVRDALQVSDNPAFNRLFDVVGRDRANAALAEWGYGSVRIQSRLAAASRDPAVQGRAPAVGRRSGRGERSEWEPWLAERTATRAVASIAAPGVEVGRAYIDEEGQRVEGPLSFATHNAASLDDLVRLLVHLTEPGEHAIDGALPLSDEARQWVVQTMTEPPPASRRLDAATRRRMLRPLEAGVLDALGPNEAEAVRVTSKVGYSYGYFIDVARIAHARTRRRFFVGVVVYANANGVLNDDRYETEALARPFVEALGRQLAPRLQRGVPRGTPR